MDRKLERLKQKGISVQSIVLQTRSLIGNFTNKKKKFYYLSFSLALEVQMHIAEREIIPAGVRIHFISSPRGSFIRTPDGRFFAVRQMPVAQAPKPIAPLPPPPPPPQPIQSTPSLSSNFFDDLFSSKKSK